MERRKMQDLAHQSGERAEKLRSKHVRTLEFTQSVLSGNDALKQQTQAAEDRAHAEEIRRMEADTSVSRLQSELARMEKEMAAMTLRMKKAEEKATSIPRGGGGGATSRAKEEVAAVRAEMEASVRELRALTCQQCEEIAALKNRNSALQEAKEGLEDKVDGLTRTVGDQQQMARAAADMVADASAAASEAKVAGKEGVSNARLSKELAEARREKGVLADKHVALKSKHEDKTTECRSLNDVVASLQAELRKEKDKAKRAGAQHLPATDTGGSMRAELAAALAELQEYRQRTGELEADNDGMARKVLEMREEIDTLKKRLRRPPPEELPTSSPFAAFMSVKKENEGLKQTISALASNGVGSTPHKTPKRTGSGSRLTRNVR